MGMQIPSKGAVLHQAVLAIPYALAPAKPIGKSGVCLAFHPGVVKLVAANDLSRLHYWIRAYYLTSTYPRA
jgi:hypothetical protein